MWIKWNFICTEFIAFVWKQGYACIFWGFLLFCFIVTKFFYPIDFLYRYDALLLLALGFQIALLALKLEQWREVIVIGIFHLVALVMEIFKTLPSIASWSYPEPFVIGILGVPLFAGFMYSAVGSYLARVWRIFDFRFVNYPNISWSVALAVGIYANFFTHHFIADVRYFLVLWVLFLFWRTRIYFTPRKTPYSMNLVLWFCLVAIFIWFAENIATAMNVWIYPNQSITWVFVSPQKILAWFLLVILSFVLVSLIHKPKSI